MKIFKKKKQTEKLIPRSMDEIKAAYETLKAQAGELQYLIHVKKEELELLNKSLRGLNNEAGARAQLDKENEKPNEEPVK